MVSKGLQLRYNSQQWNWIMGSHIMHIRTKLDDLLERFPHDFRITSATDFKTGLMSLINSENIYEDLVKRAAYACTNSK